MKRCYIVCTAEDMIAALDDSSFLPTWRCSNCLEPINHDGIHKVKCGNCGAIPYTDDEIESMTRGIE